MVGQALDFTGRKFYINKMTDIKQVCKRESDFKNQVLVKTVRHQFKWVAYMHMLVLRRGLALQ